ncbi:MAG: cyclic nucleotide-binding protein [Chlamydiales bacterium]|jgi:CRP-like cAMP-binding protein|nr:cyclic nucleotide-binding protein [Chlamydiales bacterium]
MMDEFGKYLQSYKAEEIVIREGEKDSFFFCLLHGSISIWKGGDLETREGMIKIGEIKEKGEYFGEISALLMEPRSATIIASEPLKVLKIPGEMLPSMITQQPKLGLKICSDLANRLRGTTNQQQDVTKQRNELRDDSTNQLLHAKDSFQKLFVMLTALQTQLIHPQLKGILEWMATDKLIQGGRKIRIDEAFLNELPSVIVDAVRKAYADVLI